jgi:hypothetical protein
VDDTALLEKEMQSSFKLEFDERTPRREVEKHAETAIDEIARNVTRDLARPSSQYGGHPTLTSHFLWVRDSGGNVVTVSLGPE